MLTQSTSTETPWLDRIVIRYLVKADLPALEWNGEYRHFRRLYQDVYQNYSLGRAVMWVADLPGVELVGQLFIQLASSLPEGKQQRCAPRESLYLRVSSKTGLPRLWPGNAHDAVCGGRPAAAGGFPGSV